MMHLPNMNGIIVQCIGNLEIKFKFLKQKVYKRTSLVIGLRYMKILIRGGSIPAGHGVARGYPDILRELFLPDGIEIINRSRDKETSFEGIETFREDIDPFRPDILVIHFGIDDAFGGVYRSEFKENLVQIVRAARERFNPLMLLATSHPFEDPNDMKAVEIYYNAIGQVAADLGCDLIPVHIYWSGYLRARNLQPRDFVQNDSRYPNEKGHEIFAEAIRWKLNRAVEAVRYGTGFIQY